MEADLILRNKTMNSLEISELTGKRHSDVLEAIRTMESAWEKVTERKFPLSEYKDITGRSLPCYQLNKTECLYIATKFNDEARAKLVIRWEQLEDERKELSRKDLALMVLQSEEEKERLQLISIEQQKTIETQAPKVLFANAVIAADNSILIGNLAKVLKQNGIDMGQNRLFEWMREKGYLCKSGEQYNQPTQSSMEKGLFEVSYNTIVRSDKTIQTVTTKVTGKGQMYFVNKFLKHSN